MIILCHPLSSVIIHYHLIIIRIIIIMHYHHLKLNMIDDNYNYYDKLNTYYDCTLKIKLL